MGAVGAIVGGTMQSTHSAFTASAVDRGNTFAVGTLVMSNNNAGAGGGCTNVAASSCGSTISFSSGHLQPGAVYQQPVTITNSGTLPATMTLLITNITDNVGSLKAFVNFTIHDDTKGVCLYGTAGNASCDSLANLTTLVPADALTSATSPMTLVGSSRADQRWSPGELHTITFSIEIETTNCSGFSPAPNATPNPTPIVPVATSTCDNNQTSFNMVWTGVQ